MKFIKADVGDTTNPLDRHLNSCEGKAKIPTRAMAKRRANKIRTTGGDRMQVYQCTACGFWHLGHRGGATGRRYLDHAREARARLQATPAAPQEQRKPEPVITPNFDGRQACLNDTTFNDGRATADKRATCNRCPCLPECFAWSIQFEPFGFWAGMSATERKKIRDKYAIRAAFDSSGAPRSLEDA